MTHALLLNEVSKSFGPVQAVDQLSLAVPEGVIYGFIGPNGAGKTTAIRMIMSILYPDTGTITVLGNPVPEAVKDRLGYLPEEKGLYKKMRAAELVAYFGRLKGMSRHDAWQRSRELLRTFGLDEWAERRCEALSKGMSQKVQILSTLIHEPELVILDEPFSGLDPVNVDVVRELIVELRRGGRTVIFSTHVMEQAEQICDFIVLIDKGRTVLNGPLADVKGGGPRSVIIDYDGDGSALRDLPGVLRISDAGKRAELVLRDDADPQAILTRLVSRLTIHRFDTRAPSLHEVFVRAVGKPSDA